MKPGGETSSDPLKKIVVHLGDRSNAFVLSPMRLMTTLLLSVFVIETAVMIWLEGEEPVGWQETLIDSSILTVVLFFILYYSLFKPLVLLIDDYSHKQAELNDKQVLLELEVQERSRSEMELRETRAILQAAMDQSPAGLAIADAPDGALRYVNDAGLMIRGADRQALIDGVGIEQYVKSWQLLDLDGNPLKKEEVPLARVIQSGEKCSSELIIRNAIGDDRIVIVNAAPIRDDKGEVVAGVAVFLDITERIRVEAELKLYQNHLEKMVAERSQDLEQTSLRLKLENEEHVKAKSALLESEERFRQIFEQSEDAIVLINPQDNSIIDANPTAERIFRKKREELLAGGLPELCQPEGHKHLVPVLEQIVQDNIPGLVERLECFLDPGEFRTLSFHGKKIHLQGSEVVYTTFRDITTRVRLEEQAREIQARLIQTNRMTSLGTMVSSVAHEINNPNNFLLMNAGIIKRAWDDIVPVIEEFLSAQWGLPRSPVNMERRPKLPARCDRRSPAGGGQDQRYRG